MGIDDMLELAYTEMGLTVDRFLALSWYEWTLECLKLKKRYEKEHKEWEWSWARTRSLWLILANSNRDSKVKPTPFEPDDLITLSFDKNKEAPKSLTIEEIREMERNLLKK